MNETAIHDAKGAVDVKFCILAESVTDDARQWNSMTERK